MGMESDDHDSAETCQVFCGSVMLGDGNADLSSLPREWREMIERMKAEG